MLIPRPPPRPPPGLRDLEPGEDVVRGIGTGLDLARRPPLLGDAVLDDGLGLALVLDDHQILTRLGHPGQADDLDRHRGRRLLQLLPVVVQKRPNTAGDTADRKSTRLNSSH